MAFAILYMSYYRRKHKNSEIDSTFHSNFLEGECFLHSHIGNNNNNMIVVKFITGFRVIHICTRNTSLYNRSPPILRKLIYSNEFLRKDYYLKGLYNTNRKKTPRNAYSFPSVRMANSLGISRRQPLW